VTPTRVSRVLVVGSCFTEWIARMAPTLDRPHEADFLLAHGLGVLRLPEVPPHPVDTYDFQVIQIPLREILIEQTYFRLPYDTDAWRSFLDQRCEAVRVLLNGLMTYNERHGLLTFVINFLAPQQDPMGRLFRRSDPRNLVYVVNRLNEVLEDEVVSQYSNAHVVDADQIAGTFGKKYIQEDVLWSTSHGSVFADYDYDLDQGRLEPTLPLDHYYTLRPEQFKRAVWVEILSHYRTIRRIDTVKLVIVDLDDTLWRGVVAEKDQLTDETIEGWPLGIIEALCVLKKRGVLLGIVSRNDEATIEAIWEPIFRGRLSLSDFAVRKINWGPKVDNLEVAMSQLSLLPRNVVYIDDNPVERHAVSMAFPEIRVLGRRLYHLRRILLWSPETQVASVTEESARRTEMVHAQIERDQMKSRVSRSDFLTDLRLKVHLVEIDSTSHPKLTRALELLNKTNQFNTTGRRWSLEEVAALLAGNGMLLAFEAEDRFTSYGIVGVVVLRPAEETLHIVQFVMSCRVISLDIEIAVLSDVMRRARGTGVTEVAGCLNETDANFPARGLYVRAGFDSDGGDSWSQLVRAAQLEVPPHIEIT
jgi:FkbH-like protein